MIKLDFYSLRYMLFKLYRKYLFCSVHKRVHDVMHQAFWDLLSQELQDDPPCFEQALSLLREIKKVLVFLHIFKSLYMYSFSV